jgi:hypothetical protein
MHFTENQNNVVYNFLCFKKQKIDSKIYIGHRMS